MKKNMLLLGAVAALCVPGIASCGPKNQVSSGPTTGTSTPQPSIPPTSGLPSTSNSDTSCRNAPASAIRVNFWHALNSVNKDAISKLTAEFNAEHSNAICVEMTSQTSYDAIFDTINSTIRADETLPDIATTYPDHVATYAESNAVVDLKQFVKDAGVGMPATGSDSWEDFLPNYRKESTNYRFSSADLQAEEGKMYSLPLNKSTEVMYYNKTFFDYWTGKPTPKLANGKSLSQNRTENDGQPSIFGDTLQDQIRTAGEGMTQAEADEFNKRPYGGLIEWNGNWVTPTAAGLKHPGDIDPKNTDTWWTWDDIRTQGEIVQVITKTKHDLFLPQIAFYNSVTLDNAAPSDPIDIVKTGNPIFSYDSSSNLFVTLANQVNSYVKMTAKGDKAVPELLFNQDEALQLYGDYEDMYTDGIATIPGVIGNGSLKYATVPFNKSYLFLSAGSIAGASQNASGPFETATAPIPQANIKNPKIIQQGTNITMLAYDGNKVNVNDGTAKTAKLKAAWQYMKYISSNKANLDFATNTNYMPCRSSVIESEAYKAHLAVNMPERKAMATAIDISTTSALFTDPPFASSGTIRSGAETVILNALKSKEETMRAAILSYYDKSTQS